MGCRGRPPPSPAPSLSALSVSTPQEVARRLDHRPTPGSFRQRGGGQRVPKVRGEWPHHQPEPGVAEAAVRAVPDSPLQRVPPLRPPLCPRRGAPPPAPRPPPALRGTLRGGTVPHVAWWGPPSPRGRLGPVLSSVRPTRDPSLIPPRKAPRIQTAIQDGRQESMHRVRRFLETL